MSGHSKWAQIKRQKGTADVKRGLTFTKISNAITIAVKQGGGVSDPEQNFKLRLAIDAAKNANMPKENVERAILRAKGKEARDIEEVIYEGFAPGGVSVIIEAATDKPNRTTSEVKGIFNKAGASFGQPGSVVYQFKSMGQIIVKKNERQFDEVFQVAADNGAEDVEDLGDEAVIYSSPSDVGALRDILSGNGFDVLSAEIVRQAVNKIEIKDDESLSKIGNFVENLENLDDVQRVYTNIS